MNTTYHYVVVFRRDTDSAFETCIKVNSPVSHKDAPYTPHLIIKQAHVISRLHDGDKPCSLDGYSPFSIIHNRKTIKKF